MDRIGTEFVAYARIAELLAAASSHRLADAAQDRRRDGSQDEIARMRRAVAAFFLSHSVTDPNRPFVPRPTDYLTRR